MYLMMCGFITISLMEAVLPQMSLPSFDAAQVMVRAGTVGLVKEIMNRMEKIYNGAALMTETTVNAEVGKILDNKIPNLTLNDLLMKHARALNAPNCQSARKRTGSTDFANVMHRVPGSCIRVAFVLMEPLPIRRNSLRPVNLKKPIRPCSLAPRSLLTLLSN